MLSTSMSSDTKENEVASQPGSLTGVIDLAGWQQVLAEYDAAAGRDIGIITIQLNDLALFMRKQKSIDQEQLLQKAVTTLQKTICKSDTFAYLGNRQLAILAKEADSRATQALAKRLHHTLAMSGLKVSIATTA